MTKGCFHWPEGLWRKNEMVKQFNGFQLDWDQRELIRNGEAVPVEPKSLELIHFLIENRHRTVGKDEIAEAVWPDRVISDSVISQTVRKARKALDDDGETQHTIATVRGFGFRFVAPTEDAPGPGQRAAPSRPAWQVPAIAAAILLVAIAAFLLRPPPASAPEIISIALIAESDVAPEDLPEWLSDSVAEILRSSLAISDNLILVPAAAIAAQRELSASDEILHGRLREHLGVDWIVTGNLKKTNSGWRMELQLDERGSDPKVLTLRSDEVMPLLLASGRRLVTELDGRPMVTDPLLDDPWLNETFHRGVHAARRGDPAHSLTLFEAVLDHAPDFDRARYEWAVAKRQSGQVEEGMEVLEELLTAEHLSDPRLRRMAANALGITLWHQGRLNEAAEYFAIFAREAELAGHVLDHAHGELNRGMVASSLGQFKQAETHLIDAMARFTQQGYQPGRALTANSLGVLAWQRGLVDDSELWHREALGTRLGLGNQRDIAQSLFNLGTIAASRLDWDESERLFEQARMIHQSLGNHERVTRILINQGQNRALNGRLASGRQRLLEGLSAAEQAGALSLKADATYRLGMVALLEDQPKVALEWFDRTLVGLKIVENPGLALSTRLGRVRALRLGGESTNADQALAGILAEYEDAEELPSELRLEKARMLMANDENPAAIEQLEDIFDSQRASRNLHRQVMVGKLLVEAHLSQGDIDAAQAVIQSLPDRVLMEGVMLDLQARIAWETEQWTMALETKQRARERLDERWSVHQEARLREWQEHAGTLVAETQP